MQSLKHRPCGASASNRDVIDVPFPKERFFGQLYSLLIQHLLHLVSNQSRERLARRPGIRDELRDVADRETVRRLRMRTRGEDHERRQNGERKDKTRFK